LGEFFFVRSQRKRGNRKPSAISATSGRLANMAADTLRHGARPAGLHAIPLSPYRDVGTITAAPSHNALFWLTIVNQNNTIMTMDTPPSSSHPSLADALFGKTRKAVIALLFSQPDKSWHLREMARVAGVSPTMLSKEANSLMAAGIIVDQRDGNRRRLMANPRCPIYEELRGIARKTAGIADIVKNALQVIPGIDCAFIFGSVARGDERSGSDVDVCVIGDALNRSVSSAMSAIEPSMGRPASPLVYTAQEFREKARNGNPFVIQLLTAEKMFLIGDDDALERTIGKPRNSAKLGRT
jgi:AraC-like DNA-binding protein